MDGSGPAGFLFSLVREVFLGIIKAGQVPKHVAFIMDGNRRFARKRSKGSTGHTDGFNALASILDFSYRVGVKEVTVFAFSIENFKRSPKEVDTVMEIAENRLQQICENGELVDKYGIRVNILGDISRLPRRVNRIAEKVIAQTRNNNRAVLNVCMPYTARDDLTHAIKSIVNGVEKGRISADSINGQTLSDHLYTAESYPLDLLIRTSGMMRLSDFLLWEIDAHKTDENIGTEIVYSEVLWPEYSVWNYFKALLYWGYLTQAGAQ